MGRHLIDWGKAASIAICAGCIGGILSWVADEASGKAKVQITVDQHSASIASFDTRITNLEQWKDAQQYQYFTLTNELRYIHMTLHKLDTNLDNP